MDGQPLGHMGQKVVGSLQKAFLLLPRFWLWSTVPGPNLPVQTGPPEPGYWTGPPKQPESPSGYRAEDQSSSAPGPVVVSADLFVVSESIFSSCCQLSCHQSLKAPPPGGATPDVLRGS